MTIYLSTKTGLEIDSAVDKASAALPKTGGTISGNITVTGTTVASNLSGTNTGDQVASQVTNTPAGMVLATDVQSAINELDVAISDLKGLTLPISYGLNWNETNDTYLRTGDIVSNFSTEKTVQKEMKRCTLNADGTVNYFLLPTDSTLKADGFTPSVLTGADGNVMVQIPKFYYKYNYNTASGVVHEHTISLLPIDGGTVHPAFVQDGVEKDFRYYRAYQGSVVDSKLVSISGAYVDTNITRDAFRTAAELNGAGWHVTDWMLHEAVTLLAIIEYGTMNLQSAIGNGRVSLSAGTWVDGSYYGINGLSNSTGNFSGNNTYVGDADDAGADLSYMSFRGCENLWGNTWQFLDGININDNAVYLNDNPATFADDTVTNYTDIGVTMHNANGYGRTLGNSNKGFFIAGVAGGASNVGTTDYYYQDAGWRVALVGGSATHDLRAGPLGLNARNSSTAVFLEFGAGVSF